MDPTKRPIMQIMGNSIILPMKLIINKVIPPKAPPILPRNKLPKTPTRSPKITPAINPATPTFFIAFPKDAFSLSLNDLKVLLG